MLSFRGIDNRVLLPARCPTTALLHGLHGHRQHPQPGAPERAAADHGLAALLGDRVPRRRLPLRPRVGARARVLRRRPPLGVLRRDPPGSGALAGEADRRAVGRRAGRLPGRQLPGALGASGTGTTATRCATSGAARATSARSRRASPARATCTATTAAPVRLDQLHHRPRRLHAARPRLLQHKHNEANLEDNHDGTDDNRSWNCGAEGPTDDPAVLALRARQQRNLLATLLLSQGVPMLLGGDELGRTQGGNNNAWCQDNEISWLDWEDERTTSCATSRGGCSRCGASIPCSGGRRS